MDESLSNVFDQNCGLEAIQILLKESRLLQSFLIFMFHIVFFYSISHIKVSNQGLGQNNMIFLQIFEYRLSCTYEESLDKLKNMLKFSIFFLVLKNVSLG